MKLFSKEDGFLINKKPYIIPLKQPRVRDPKMWVAVMTIFF